MYVIGEYAGALGLGLLRLHSTYRHDLKIYASDEGRVQMTAAAFAKGLLALEVLVIPLYFLIIILSITGRVDTYPGTDGEVCKHKWVAR